MLPEKLYVSQDNAGLYELTCQGKNGTLTIAMLAGDDDLEIDTKANAEAIAARFNACAGITNQALESGVIADLLNYIIPMYDILSASALDCEELDKPGSVKAVYEYRDQLQSILAKLESKST